jgi:fatty acid desaturase
MTGLDIFALIVLIVLVVSFLAIWAMLGMYPGKIAHQRNHPQADAISVCGWWGAITMGILSPIAFIWAYTNPEASLTGRPKMQASNTNQAEQEHASEVNS